MSTATADFFLSLAVSGKSNSKSSSDPKSGKPSSSSSDRFRLKSTVVGRLVVVDIDEVGLVAAADADDDGDDEEVEVVFEEKAIAGAIAADVVMMDAADDADKAMAEVFALFAAIIVVMVSTP